MARAERYLTELDAELEALDAATLERDYPTVGAQCGWRIKLTPGEPHRVDVLLEAGYPFAPPIVGTRPLEAELSSGLVANGTLCLEGPDDPVSVSPEPEALHEILNRARVRIARGDAEADPVRTVEVAPYWERHAAERRILADLDDKGPSRIVAFAMKNDEVVVGESLADVATWLKRTRTKDFSDPRPTVMLDLPAVPIRWLQSGRDLLMFLDAHGAEDAKAVLVAASILPRPFPVVLRCCTADGTVLLGVRFDADDPSADERPGYLEVPFSPREPFFDTPLSACAVRRVDRAWLLERSIGRSTSAFDTRRILFVGAGSLGSSIVRRAVKLGLVDLVILDPERLEWDNVMRHELGGYWEGIGKAKALETTIERDFPFVRIAGLSTRWEVLWAEAPEVVRGMDLIVSTTGNWPSEAHLNYLGRTEPDFPPIAFAWFEERAAAGHLLYVGSNGGCLQCGMTAHGLFSEQVVRFPPAVRVPGCATFYEPYSALEASRIADDVVEQLLECVARTDRTSFLSTMLGNLDRARAVGGVILDRWSAENGDPGSGRRRITKAWPARCPLCR